MRDYERNLKQNIGAPDSWCILPWTHVSVKGNGTYRVCCHSAASESRGTLKNADGVALHIASASWDEVMNSQMMKEVRRDMLRGQWPEPCLRCKRESSSGMSSRNKYERSMLAEIIEPELYPGFDKALSWTEEDGAISQKNFPVTFLDIRFGNKCNLKCVMCSPTDSSQWYDDYHKVWGYEHFWDSGKKIALTKGPDGRMRPEAQVFDWSEDPFLWAQIESQIEHFRRLYIVGGEPLLIDAHYDFLQKCVDGGYAQKLTIEYNSNITHVPSRALDLWRHFKAVIIGISLDGVAEVNDFIRFPSRWGMVEKNLKQLMAAEGNFIFHITTTVSILNIWHLPQFLEYLLQSNFPRLGTWEDSPLASMHPVHRPHYLNLNILEEGFKKKISEHFKLAQERISQTDWLGLHGQSHGSSWEKKVKQTCAILNNYIDYMHQIVYEENDLIKWRSNCVHFLDSLNQLRHTRWEEVCPELFAHTQSWRELPKGLY